MHQGLYEVIAVLQYGSVFIAIGSTCTEMKETQGLMMPVMLVIMVPLVFFVRCSRSRRACWSRRSPSSR